MFKLFIRRFNRLSFMIMCFCLFFESDAQKIGSAVFSMHAANAQSISIGQTFTTSTTISPFTRSAEIYGLDMSADISLDHYASLVRVILIDNNFDEYMVYEVYPRITDKNVFSVRNICEETFLLNAVRPKSLKIEIVDASVTLHGISVSYTPHRMSDEQFNEYYEDIREKQIDQKIIALNKYIRENGMNWKAERTDISHLPYREKKYLINGDHIFNWQGFEYHTKGVFEIWSKNGRPSNKNDVKSSELRKEFDWRNRHGANDPLSPYYDGDTDGGGWCTAIKKQSCNHCWAFCPTGTLESLVNVWFNQHLDLDLSEQDAASCSGGAAGDCDGGSSSKVVSYIVETGIVDEECFKYTKTEDDCDNICSNPTERIQASGRERVTNDIDEMKRAIIQHGPITSGVRSMWHFMCLVGFKEDSNGDIIWIFKNSHGTTSGENGFKLIKVDLDDFYGQYILNGPFLNLNNLEVACVDKDNDGYYNWGIGPKPSTCPDGCPDSADGNDNDPTLGPFDENFNEIPITTSVSNYASTYARKFFTVYPGPEKETFYVNIKNGASRTYTIKLLDLSGKVLLNAQRKAGKSLLRAGGLASGIYYVSVHSGGFNYTQKILIR